MKNKSTFLSVFLIVSAVSIVSSFSSEHDDQALADGSPFERVELGGEIVDLHAQLDANELEVKAETLYLSRSHLTGQRHSYRANVIDVYDLFLEINEDVIAAREEIQIRDSILRNDDRGI